LGCWIPSNLVSLKKPNFAKTIIEAKSELKDPGTGEWNRDGGNGIWTSFPTAESNND